MDAGLTADPYEANALVFAAPFKLYVIVGQTTNTPIQMAGDFSLLGQPGRQTRLDLTLGDDTNGDGLPDAWERAFLAAIGSSLGLADLRPNVDYTGDGRTLLQEFLLGNYPFDPADSFHLRLLDPNGGSALLQFTTMTGRSYTVLGSPDLQQWTPLSFQVQGEPGTPAPVHSYYFASGIQTLQIQVLQPATGPAMQFFRMLLQ